MDTILDAFHWIIALLRDPGPFIEWAGYPGLALIVFLETGAMIFFLPGDSLLIIAGIYAAKGDLDLLALNALLIPMAILGDALSYTIGKRIGPMIFSRPKSRFFNPAHVQAAHEFYERHGGKAIIIARFMPLVRTFVPVVAGVAKMGYRKFAAFNVIGGAAWVASMTVTGYFLVPVVNGLVRQWAGYETFTVEKHIEKVIIIVVFFSILPGLIEWLKARRRAAA